MEHGQHTDMATAPGPLLGFVALAYPEHQKIRAPEHLAPMADIIEAAERGPVRACISVPPRHGASTLLAAAIVRMLLRKPTAQILYVSHGREAATRQTATALDIARRFDIPLGRWTRAFDWITRAGGRVVSAGIGSQLAGETFDLVVVHNPHKNRAEAESAIIREKTIEAVLYDVVPRAAPSGSVLIVHHRWRADDVIGAVSERNPRWPRLNLPAVVGGGASMCALAPDLWPLERLLEIKANVGPRVWASNYQGEPV